jgi:hypothetical protein
MRAWWQTSHSSLVTHRRLKWLWIFPGIPASLWLRESVPWLVFISVYAVIVSHWTAEESVKKDAIKEEAEEAPQAP